MIILQAIEEVGNLKTNIEEHFEQKGEKVSKEQKFLDVINNVGSLAGSILDQNLEEQKPDLNKLIFLYISYIESFKSIPAEEITDFIQDCNELKNRNYSKEVLLLAFQEAIVKENKAHNEGKDKNKEVNQINNMVIEEINKYRALAILSLLGKGISNTNNFISAVEQVINEK